MSSSSSSVRARCCSVPTSRTVKASSTRRTTSSFSCRTRRMTLKTSVAVNDDTDDVRAVFDAWVQSTGKTRAVLDSKRRARIVGALKNFTVDELVDAVRGWRHSPHHRGENERRTVYNDLDLLLRDAARIEKFRDLERGAAMPAPPRASKSHTNISAVADRLREVEREQERSRNGAQAADRQLLP